MSIPNFHIFILGTRYREISEDEQLSCVFERVFERLKLFEFQNLLASGVFRVSDGSLFCLSEKMELCQHFLLSSPEDVPLLCEMVKVGIEFNGQECSECEFHRQGLNILFFEFCKAIAKKYIS
ncbi:hypothetical protein ISTM_430 [Insectomime virus]|nr:hypothetical protein ISTM_430 [Insectomime virus]